MCSRRAPDDARATTPAMPAPVVQSANASVNATAMQAVRSAAPQVMQALLPVMVPSVEGMQMASDFSIQAVPWVAPPPLQGSSRLAVVPVSGPHSSNVCSLATSHRPRQGKRHHSELEGVACVCESTGNPCVQPGRCPRRAAWRTECLRVWRQSGAAPRQVRLSDLCGDNRTSLGLTELDLLAPIHLD